MDESLLFPNDVYIFKKDGTQIDPKSSEGGKIIKIFQLQEDIRQQNKEQTLKWIMETFPRDKESQEKYKKKFGI